MALPKREENQLTKYYEQELSARSQGLNHAGNGFFWYGYPAYTDTISGYGALSTSPNPPQMTLAQQAATLDAVIGGEAYI